MGRDKCIHASRGAHNWRGHVSHRHCQGSWEQTEREFNNSGNGSSSQPQALRCCSLGVKNPEQKSLPSLIPCLLGASYRINLWLEEPFDSNFSFYRWRTNIQWGKVSICFSIQTLPHNVPSQDSGVLTKFVAETATIYRALCVRYWPSILHTFSLLTLKTAL